MWAITHTLFWNGEARSVSELPFPLNWIGWAFGIKDSGSRSFDHSDIQSRNLLNPGQSISEIDTNQVKEFVTDPQTQAPRLIMSFLGVSPDTLTESETKKN